MSAEPVKQKRKDKKKKKGKYCTVVFIQFLKVVASYFEFADHGEYHLTRQYIFLENYSNGYIKCLTLSD